MPRLVFYLVLFTAGVLWALWTAFGEALFAGWPRPARSREPGGAGSFGRTAAAAFVTGFGGAGAVLCRAGRVSGGLETGLALAAGALVTALVVVLVRWLHPGGGGTRPEGSRPPS